MRDDAVLGRALPLDRGLGPSEDDLRYIEQQIPDTVWSATQNINIYRANVITI